MLDLFGNPVKLKQTRSRITPTKEQKAERAKKWRRENAEKLRIYFRDYQRKKVKPSKTVKLILFKFCQECSKPFETTQVQKIYCSRKCKCGTVRELRRKADARRKRRAQKRGVAYEIINHIEVFERDQWQCQICKQPVRRDRMHGLPDSPELDHIVPLSRGGSHIGSNVQLACHDCNQRKHAKIPRDVRLGAEAAYREAHKKFRRHGATCWMLSLNV